MPAGEPTLVHVAGRHLRLTNLDKVMYPATGTTKAEVLQHYALLAPVILPLLRGRCVTRIRWPHGVARDNFLEKNVPPGTPEWVRVVEVPSSEGTVRFPVIDDLATLMWLVNLSALELHVHQWRVDADGQRLPPDRVVIDLDPGPSADLTHCAEAALLARDWLAERGLSAVPVLSGSKGIHLYAALTGEEWAEPDSSKRAAHALATALARARPDLVTATMTKAQRVGRVFVDWSQNSPSKTTLSPYSLRGREHPTVAMPLTWDEMEGGAGTRTLTQVTMSACAERIGHVHHLLADL